MKQQRAKDTYIHKTYFGKEVENISNTMTRTHLHTYFKGEKRLFSLLSSSEYLVERKKISISFIRPLK